KWANSIAANTNASSAWPRPPASSRNNPMSAPALDPAPVPTARPRRRTQAERRQEAEKRLLDAALEVVARRGSVRMTLAEVGEVAGYSRGLAAHRFGNKAGLLRALVAH